jgi:predicted metal-dependent phosphotriesterase family hydrolase
VSDDWQHPTVETTRGPVAADDLGRVLMHEHIFVLTTEMQQNYPDEWGSEDDRVADAVSRLRELPRNGISTIVDVTAIGQGRNIPRVKRIADQVPELNIVVATGIYTFDEIPLFFWRRPEETPTWSSRCAAAATPTAWCWPTTPAATSTGSAPARSTISRTGTTCTSARTSCRT